MLHLISWHANVRSKQWLCKPNVFWCLLNFAASILVIYKHGCDVVVLAEQTKYKNELRIYHFGIHLIVVRWKWQFSGKGVVTPARFIKSAYLILMNGKILFSLGLPLRYLFIFFFDNYDSEIREITFKCRSLPYLSKARQHSGYIVLVLTAVGFSHTTGQSLHVKPVFFVLFCFFVFCFCFNADAFRSLPGDSNAWLIF